MSRPPTRLTGRGTSASPCNSPRELRSCARIPRRSCSKWDQAMCWRQLARQHTGFPAAQLIVSSLADGHSGEGDAASLMNALGALWTAGIQPRWADLHRGEPRLRISLPTYPFERKRYWLESKAAEDIAANAPAPTPEEFQSSFLPPVSTEEKEVSSLPSASALHLMPQSAFAPGQDPHPASRTGRRALRHGCVAVRRLRHFSGNGL